MCKVLIVDDNKQNLSLMRDFTEGWGYTVVVAMHGSEVLDKAMEERPDAILLDIMLPGKSGYEVCKELRSNEITRYTPVIMVTALMDNEDRLHGLRVGADYFLLKPLSYEELKIVLENLISKKRCLDISESGPAVVKALAELVQHDEVDNTKTRHQKLLDYGVKMAQVLHWSEEAQTQLNLGLSLYYAGLFEDVEQRVRFLQALEGLKLQKWLQPLVEGVADFTSSEQISAGPEVQQLINLLAVLLSYAKSWSKLKNNDKVLAELEEKKIYDVKTLDALQVILAEQKMLDFLKTE